MKSNVFFIFLILHLMKNNSSLLQLLKFSLVGGLGFCVDVGAFYIANQFVNLTLARLLAFICAVFFTFLLNRSFTFLIKGSKRLVEEFIKYFFSMILGGAANLGLSLYLLYYFRVFDNYQFIPLAFGSLAGLMINFGLSRKIFSKVGENSN